MKNRIHMTKKDKLSSLKYYVWWKFRVKGKTEQQITNVMYRH